MASQGDRQAPGTPLEQSLADRDAACPRCGYNLRGLKGERCPECGEPVSLESLENRIPRGVFVVGFVGLSLGLVAHACAVVALIGYGWPFSHETAGCWGMLYALLGGIAADLALSALWYFGRFRVGRRHPALRWLLAILLFPAAFLGIGVALMPR